MVLERKEMETELRSKARGGKGECAFTPLAGKIAQKHLKLLSEVSIPPGASIGTHQHIEETEYYVILSGTGVVDDDGVMVEIKEGDVVITSDGQSHSIEATGTEDLRFLAVIVTDA